MRAQITICIPRNIDCVNAAGGHYRTSILIPQGFNHPQAFVGKGGRKFVTFNFSIDPDTPIRKLPEVLSNEAFAQTRNLRIAVLGYKKAQLNRRIHALLSHYPC